MKRLLPALAAVAVLVSACSSGDDPSPGGAGNGSASTPTVSASPEPVDSDLQQFYDQQLTWSECSGRFECAKLTVPLSYADPGGDTIELALLRAPAEDPDKRQGSLVLNPGGPGGSGIDYARAARVVVTGPLLNNFDIVGFDPRGVGKSSPIDCLTDRQLDRFLNADPNPETDEDVAATVAVAKRFGPRCETVSPELISNVSTDYAVRDMDILRQALGDDQLNFLGKSYGTVLGATYAQLFPSRVGRFVLDGAVDPQLSIEELSYGQAIGFETALLRFAQWCAEENNCPIGEDPEAGVEKIKNLLADMEENPLPAAKDRPLTAAFATTGILGSLYSAEDGWQSLFYALEGAFEGDGFGLQAVADWFLDRRPNGKFVTNATEAFNAVSCLDAPYEVDPAGTQELAEQWSQQAPVFGAALAWSNLTCYFWPVDAVGGPETITAEGAAPIVVIGTKYDPATPYEWAVSLADQLSSGILVSWDGDGHTAYYSGSDCVDDAVDRYFVDGTLPEDGLECE